MDLGNEKLISSEEESQLLEALHQFETTTGVDLAIVIAKQSDPYPAARWRISFLMTWFAFILATLFWEFHPQTLLPFLLLALMVPIFLFTKVPVILSLGLVEEEKTREVKEKSLEEFLLLQSEIPGKSLCLLYLSQLERRAELLFSVDLQNALGPEIATTILNETMNQFRHRNYKKGLIELGHSLAKHMPAQNSSATKGLHLPNKIFYR